jgi:hypothetical protein
MELEVTSDGGTGGDDGDWKNEVERFKFSQQSDTKESPAVFLTLNRWAEDGRIITSNIQKRS